MFPKNQDHTQENLHLGFCNNELFKYLRFAKTKKVRKKITKIY